MKDWSVVYIGDIADVSYGYTAKASQKDVGPKLLRITDIQDGSVDWESVPYCPISDDDLLKHKLTSNDIVFARTGATTGKSYLVLNPPLSVAASYLIRLRLKSSDVLPEFISLFFQTTDYWETIKVGTIGSAQGGFNASKLSKLKLPSPPLPEQRQIVAILDKAFEGIDRALGHADKNLANARELFESYLNNVFTQKGEGWVEKKLGDVCLIKPPKREAREKLGNCEMVSFVPMSNLNILQKALTLDEEKPLSKVAGSYTYFAENDVLLAKITPCFENGKLGIARNLKNGIGFGSSEYVVYRPKDEVISDYLFYFLSQESFRKEGARRMSGAVGHKRIQKEFYEDYLLPYPDLDEQKLIASTFNNLNEKVKRLQSIYQQKLGALNELKQSLLQKAFSGELTAEAAKEGAII